MRNREDSLLEDVKRTIEKMVEDGTVEIVCVDENGNFGYGLTEKGQKIAAKFKKTKTRKPSKKDRR